MQPLADNPAATLDDPWSCHGGIQAAVDISGSFKVLARSKCQVHVSQCVCPLLDVTFHLLAGTLVNRHGIVGCPNLPMAIILPPVPTPHGMHGQVLPVHTMHATSPAPGPKDSHLVLTAISGAPSRSTRLQHPVVCDWWLFTGAPIGVFLVKASFFPFHQALTCATDLDKPSSTMWWIMASRKPGWAQWCWPLFGDHCPLCILGSVSVYPARASVVLCLALLTPDFVTWMPNHHYAVPVQRGLEWRPESH